MDKDLFEKIWGGNDLGVPLLDVRGAGFRPVSLVEQFAAGMVPIVKWNTKYIWLFVKSPKGSPVLTKLPHGQVKKYQHSLVSPEGAFKYVGQIHPATYKSPSDVYPLDGSPGVGKGWVVTGESDSNGYPEVVHDASKQHGVLLPDGDVGMWSYVSSAYEILKISSDGKSVVKDSTKPDWGAKTAAESDSDSLLHKGQPVSEVVELLHGFTDDFPWILWNSPEKWKWQWSDQTQSWSAEMGINLDFFGSTEEYFDWLNKNGKASSLPTLKVAVNPEDEDELDVQIRVGSDLIWDDGYDWLIGEPEKGEKPLEPEPEDEEEPEPEKYSPKAVEPVGTELPAEVDASLQIEVPAGTKLIATTPKPKVETPAGHTLTLSSEGEWYFDPGQQGLSMFGMTLKGAVYPASFQPSTFEDPMFPGSAIGKWDEEPGYVLKPNGTIVHGDAPNPMVWNITDTPELQPYWPATAELSPLKKSEVAKAKAKEAPKSQSGPVLHGDQSVSELLAVVAKNVEFPWFVFHSGGPMIWSWAAPPKDWPWEWNEQSKTWSAEIVPNSGDNASALDALGDWLSTKKSMGDPTSPLDVVEVNVSLDSHNDQDIKVRIHVGDLTLWTDTNEWVNNPAWAEPEAEPEEPEGSKWEIEPLHKNDDQGLPTVRLLHNGSVFDFYAQLPTGDLGKWSEANNAYVVHKIDSDPEPPGAIPVYSTMELYSLELGGKSLHLGPPVTSDLYKQGFPTEFVPSGPWGEQPWPYTNKTKWKVDGVWGGGTPTKYGKKTGKDTYAIVVLDIATGKLARGVVLHPASGKRLWGVQAGYTAKLYKSSKNKHKLGIVDTSGIPAGVYGKGPKTSDGAVAPTPAPVVAAPFKPKVAQIATSLPKLKDLEYVGSGESLGGAGEKDIYLDPSTDKKYLWKPSVAKGTSKEEKFRAASQHAAAVIAKLVRDDHVEVSIDKDSSGRTGTLQEIIPLAAKKDLDGELPASLTSQQKLDVATEHLLDWTMSQHDTHARNMLHTADGRIVSIDKEQGWKYFGDDRLDVDYHPNAKYEESEPFYNTFWKSFSEGKMDFDPVEMRGALEKMEGISSEEFAKTVRLYADTAFADKRKRRQFVQDAVLRKLHLRADFENFLTGLYEKKQGEEGTFTFDDGWMTKAQKDAQLYKTVKVSASQQASTMGIKEKEYTNTETGESRPDLRVLKVPKTSSVTALEAFLEEFGLEPIPWPDGSNMLTGSMYHMVAVTKESYENASAVKQVSVVKEESTGVVQGLPKYWPELKQNPVATDNFEEFAAIANTKLSRHGKRFKTDGKLVEGQTSKAKKFIDEGGQEYFFVHFKLRENAWKAVRASSSTSPGVFRFKEAVFDTEKDAYVETHKTIDEVATATWTVGDVETHVATSTEKWSYMGSVYMKIRSNASVQASIMKAFNYVKPGLAKQLFRNPTEEEKEVHKLSRLLWATKPQRSDSLLESDRTVSGLRAILEDSGVDLSIADRMEEEEVFPGYSAHVLPDRWRTMAGGKFRFVFQGIKSLEGAVGILSSGGIMGIHERNLHGIAAMDFHNAGSASADVKTGSADGSLCYVVCESGLNSSLSSFPFSGTCQLILHPSVLDRLDTFMHPTDSYGTSRPSGVTHASAWKNRRTVDSQVEQQQVGHRSSAELSFRRGVPLDKVVRMTVGSSSTWKTVVSAAHNAGVDKVNGVPVGDFVVVADNASDVYTRFVKPLVA